MYAKRIQLVHYGPIEKLDIEFPFDGETPKPVVLVGQNGAGKSILLSHIVNGLIAAKGIAYPETPEVETGKVYKLRDNSYIQAGRDYYFARVEFEDSFFVSEIRSMFNKREYSEVPPGVSGTDAEGLWEKLKPEDNDCYDSNFSTRSVSKITDLFARNCVLYFPFNRFEEPAWLNEENLKAEARYMDLKHLAGQTSRKVISYSPLHDNQNWLFDVIYDRATFELQTHNLNFPVNDGNTTFPLPVFSGYSGHATRTYETALQIVRTVTRRSDARFGIGRRSNRIVSIQSATGQLVPNVFQLSSGETSLLNLFLSVLRDFDLCGVPFSSAEDMRGVVVVDEIDLHLHAVHQHEVLPSLIRMFPRVQFIVTTHSPLFVLGMQKVLGEDGFALYRLPQGRQISPEEFSEFGDAYRAFTETVHFSNDIRAAIEGTQKPIVFVEGVIDEKYIQKASQFLGKETMFNRIEIRDGNGASNLKKIWDTSKHIDVVTQKTVLLFDCDYQDMGNARNETLFRQIVPMQTDNPVKKGIENLFSKETLERAQQQEHKFVDVDPGRTKTVRGQPQLVPDTWTINKDEKTNLCDWLCENGTKEDFQHFQVIFDLLDKVLELTAPNPVGTETRAAP